MVVEQREGGGDDGAHWILEGGRVLRGVDDGRRIDELRRGLLRTPGVRAVDPHAEDQDVERVVESLHDRAYLEALAGAGPEPVALERFAPPGLPPDIPVSAGLVAAAREGVRTAISAAEHVRGGAGLAYALCRPPGHHAGPAWCAGYCYLNTAAAAVQALRDAGAGPVAVVDLDYHYPNGTAAIVESMEDVWLLSLHAHPVTNVAAGTVEPTGEREVAIEYPTAPGPEEYLDAVAAGLDRARQELAVEALVVSLGYDIVAGDPHGSWAFGPEIFTEIGARLAAPGLPVCVVQEGGYALDSLAPCAESFARGLLAAPAASGAPLLVNRGIKRTGREAA